MLKNLFKFCLILILPALTFAQDWVTVRSESRLNFSGMALVEQTETRKTFIVVHDNKEQFADKKDDGKQPKTERAGLLFIEKDGTRPKYENLKWFAADGSETALPIDLESVTAIPDQPNRFAALVGNPRETTEKGRIYYFELAADRKSVRVIRIFKIPTATDGRDFEGLAIQKISGTLIAAWAERGGSNKPATIFWGELNLNKPEIKLLGEVGVKTPDLANLTTYPKAENRSISDLKIDASGGVFVTSALDGEDYGLFASAFYYVGAFAKDAGKITFNRAPSPIKLFQFHNYKAEAFEFSGNNLIFGTDDEDFGAAVYFNW